MKTHVFLALTALTLSACGQPAAETGEDGAAVAAAPAAFAQCVSCHAAQSGVNGVGPSLHGVVGRGAGGVEGFGYSAAMAGSGLTWDAATLDRYLAAPQEVVPGSRMVWTVANPAQRQEIITYLQTLR
jgi:cytochrome c